MRAILPDIVGKEPWAFYGKRIRSAQALNRMLPYERLGADDLVRQLQEETSSPAECCFYIHVPFCNRACAFCGYNKCVTGDENLIADFCDVIERQIEWVACQPWTCGTSITAVYFGGGTPTTLPPRRFARILAQINELLPIAPGCETTLESTITELDDSYIDLVESGAVNRVSLGVQSFDSDLRKSYSRIAAYDQIVGRIQSLHAAEIPTLCVDLIYNLTGQTEEIWRRDVELVTDLGLTGCSVYPLVPFPNSPMVRAGAYEEPNVQTEYHRYQTAHDTLTSIPGWDAFTPVQFGHRDRGRAQYVLAQADNKNVIALGPGAGGRIGAIHYHQPLQVKEFVQNGEFASDQVRVFRLPPENPEIESQLRLFRCNKDTLANVERLAGSREFAAFLFENGMARVDGENVFLTVDGMFWAANLAAMVIETGASG